MLKVNGKYYNAPDALKNEVDEELYLFLEEWYNDKSYIIGRTSGSTGKPKEVFLNKEDMKASAHLTNKFFRINEKSVLLLCLPVSYIAGKMMVVRALQAGAELVVVPPSFPLLAGFAKEIDFAAMVPKQVDMLLNDAEAAGKLQLIRNLLIGGAPVSQQLEQKLKSVSTQCYATYGMTETVSHVALRKLNGSGIYEALGDITFTVDDRECLVIHVPHFINKEFVTNDVVCLKDNTHFDWLGRYDNVINSGGIKFFPETVEQKISGLISQRYYITSQPDEVLGQCMVLVIEDDVWERGRLEGLMNELQNVLSKYEIPKCVYFSPCFKETGSKKIIRELKGIIPVPPFCDNG